MIVLAGDIGGTNARLALIDVDGGRARTLAERRYRTQEAPSLASIVRRFLDETGTRVEHAAFGVAGPVVKGECRLPNVPWTVRVADLARATGIPHAALINDFHAVGYGLQLLAPEDLVTLQRGEPVATGPIALIGAGTGLGQGYLLHDGEQYVVHASEGGHASFAAQSEEEWALHEFLADEWGHVSWERILSGPGLVNVYRFLVSRSPSGERPETRAEMSAEDPAAVISRRALDATDTLCMRALQLFASVLGAQAGNLALTVLATGGVYIAGGIAPKVIAKLRDGTLVDAFRHKGRLEPLLARVPVHVVVNDAVGLLGAAAVAQATP